MKNKIVLLCLVVFSAQASLIKINPEKTFVPHRLGKIEVFHEGNEFKILKNNTIHNVENYSLDKSLRNIDNNQLSKLLLHHKLHVSEFGPNEFQIKSMGQLKGGGPVLATTLYWLTKGSCWAGVGIAAGAVVTGATAATIASGGAAGAAAGVAAAGANVAIGGLGAGMAGAASTTLVAGAITGAAGAAGAATVTAIATTGTVAAATSAATGGICLAAAIESAAMTAWLAGMAAPCP